MAESERITFDDNFITINNQELEEAEELEDRKRREEEIHNLLSHAMGEFNFEDQSTLRTSIGSDDEDTTNLPIQNGLADQYREANGDNQLKVLYEVRVHEIMALNEEVQKLKLEFNDQQQKLKKNVTLLEIENERKDISLKEAQGLLVDKTEQIQNLDAQLGSTKQTVKNLENRITELNEEISVLRELNVQLEQQVILIERGFPLHNKTYDKELQESQRNKIAQLEISLDRAAEQAEHKDRQYKGLINNLKESLQDNENDLAEKNARIGQLTKNFEHTQRQCQELQKAVEELKQKQNSDRVGSPLQEELRKIREYNERTDTLCENVRKAVSEEFQEQIRALNSENRKLRETFDTQEKQLKEAQKHLQLISALEAEKDMLHNKLTEVEEKLHGVNRERSILNQKLIILEKEKDSLKEINEQLVMDRMSFENAKKENQKLKKKAQKLSTTERSVQVALPPLNSELLNLQDELVSACDNINRLEHTVELAQQENSQLKVKVRLEQDRETLIKKLQHKAAEFEKIIFEKQKQLVKPKTASIATNTEPYQDETSLLKIKYDALLYQMEAKLRKDLKREFNEKLEKIFMEFNEKLKSQTCKECPNWKEENQKLNELREEDRNAVVKLIKAWEQKFFETEKETEQRMAKLLSSKTKNDEQLLSHTTRLEQDYKEKCNKLSERLEQRAKLKIQNQKEKFMQYSLQHYEVLSNSLNKIATSLRRGNDEIFATERKFIKEKAALEQK